MRLFDIQWYPLSHSFADEFHPDFAVHPVIDKFKVLENVPSNQSVDNIILQISALNFSVNRKVMHHPRNRMGITSKQDAAKVRSASRVNANAMKGHTRIDQLQAGSFSKFVFDHAPICARVDEESAFNGIWDRKPGIAKRSFMLISDSDQSLDNRALEQQGTLPEIEFKKRDFPFGAPLNFLLACAFLSGLT
jgi:hypothetical protein